MQSFKGFLKNQSSGFVHELHPDFTHEHNIQNFLFGVNDYIPFREAGHPSSKDRHLTESVESHPENEKRLIFRQDHGKSSDATGLVAPRHMWEGGRDTPAGVGKSGKPKAARKGAMGMEKRNEMRSQVYGAEHRAPLGLNHVAQIHKEHLENHFKKPVHEQIAAEREAIGRLHRAGHLDSMDTTDAGEKTDTVKHEYDEQGRSYVARSSKGVAGHALYTSGHGEHAQHHIINTCPSQVEGCGGGVDAEGVSDTMKGGCFAPRAESQYVNASVRRACHAQAKHDPAMTRDWALAHTHALRRHAEAADVGGKWNAKKDTISQPKNGKATRFLFRPNVVDETDRSSRLSVKHLNRQRAEKGLPAITGNSYGKTEELHDPENDWHVTHSNIGPKVKPVTNEDGSIGHRPVRVNNAKDRARVNATVLAQDVKGNHITNDEGKQTPPKGSYMVTNMKRGSDMDKAFQTHITHAKYWGTGKPVNQLEDHEKQEIATHGSEAHFDGEGKKTTPDKAHYGYRVLTGQDGQQRRYDYQKQHILHPRHVDVGASGAPHLIPTDSRFKDTSYLPKDRFKSRNGKNAGHILVTTPTTSTPDAAHHSGFNHNVSQEHIDHAKANGGEYEIDKPEHQEAARGQAEYVGPKHKPEDMEPRATPKKIAKTKVTTSQAVLGALKSIRHETGKIAIPTQGRPSDNERTKSIFGKK